VLGVATAATEHVLILVPHYTHPNAPPAVFSVSTLATEDNPLSLDTA